jgi:integrase
MPVRYDPRRRKWIADVGTARDGNRTRRSFEFKREAVAFEADVVAKIETTGRFTPPRNSLTVLAAYQLWLDSRIHEAGCRESTIASYRNLGKNQLCVAAADRPEIPASKDEYGLARLRLSELTEPIVQRWADQLLREVSPTTVKRALSVLHGAIDYARRNGRHTGHNCVQPVLRWLVSERHGRLKPHKLQVGIDIPTNADANAYLHAAKAKGLMHEAMELLKVHCGLRISEVRGLLWSDIRVDDKTPVLHIRHTANDAGKIEDYAKTDAGLRTIPLPPHIVDALRRWRGVCPHRGSDRTRETRQRDAEQVARWLVTNPDATNHRIARQLRVSSDAVADVRERLRIPPSKYSYRRPVPVQPAIVEPPEDSNCPPVDPSWVKGDIRMPRAQKIARYLWHNPLVPHLPLSAALGVDRRDLWQIRQHLGLPKLKKGPPLASPLLAPDPNMPRQLPLGGEEYLVFPSEDDTGKPLARAVCLRWAAAIQLAANLKDTRDQPKYKDGKKYDRANHVWRHYFVTLMLSEGNPWKQIANLSGHANAVQVMHTYGHLVRDLEADYLMLSGATKAAMGSPKLRVVEAGDNLFGTKTADFGTNEA